MRGHLHRHAAVACVGLAAPSCLAQTRTADALAPEGPDPREIPVSHIATALGTLPGVKELPPRPAMPDVMVLSDGTRVTSRRQWAARRQEMRRILSYYAVGQMPPASGNVKGREVQSELVLGPTSELSLDIGVFTPVHRRELCPPRARVHRRRLDRDARLLRQARAGKARRSYFPSLPHEQELDAALAAASRAQGAAPAE